MAGSMSGLFLGPQQMRAANEQSASESSALTSLHTSPPFTDPKKKLAGRLIHVRMIKIQRNPVSGFALLEDNTSLVE